MTTRRCVGNGLLRSPVVVPSSGIECITSFLKNRVDRFIRLADTEGEEQLR